MRVLMVQTYYFQRGGDSTYMLGLSKLLEERGHEVVPFGMETPSNLPTPYADYFVSEIDFPSLLARRSPRAAWRVLARSVYSGEARRKIAAIADAVKPDLAHFHNIHAHLTTSIVSPLRERGIPIVWTLHDFRLVCPNTSFLRGGEICERCLPNRYYEAVLRRCKKGSLPASLVAAITTLYDRAARVPSRIDRFVAPSAFLKRKLVEGGIDPARVAVVPNFVDLDSYRALPEKGYFVYLGRLLYEKGLDYLVRAVSKLETGRLVIVGEGPVEGDLRALVRELGTDRVEFAGHRSGDELRRLVAESQFVVLPSRWYENLPFAIMEAMACSKPVVASNLGGIPEMVDDGATGMLFPMGDVDALADRLRRMLADRAAREEMGRRGREKAERLYGREVHYERIMEIYRDAAGAGRVRAAGDSSGKTGRGVAQSG
ncbi:MAG: glycosyltransferase family 1 protein [Candidatus Latescibacterota bacterium]|nr:MAG: glycosyltransferase family 1 protein [Candidatus Latescibacterota bacterium]